MGKAVALVTGASRGIGRGIALELARHGYDIVAASTGGDPNNTASGVYEVKARIEELGQRCAVVAGDLGALDDHPRMLREAEEAFGGIDVLVNNAGVAPAERLDILETTPESFDRLMRINLRGPFFFTQQVARRMVERIEAGSDYVPAIIFITSISSYTASPNRAEYCISKAGLSMAAQNFAVRLGDAGIRVFDVQPGLVQTDMTSAVTEKYDRLIADGLLVQKRWGTPEDIGKACAGLAEGYFDYASGAAIEVGGGFGIRRL